MSCRYCVDFRFGKIPGWVLVLATLSGRLTQQPEPPLGFALSPSSSGTKAGLGVRLRHHQGRHIVNSVNR